ncbi:hypothetical protein N6H14_01135 [Paenibacillus sp. CC-CFT747]|nr:hypothetical protein N6H14_01135 [Paenibacillus sp. CC-CFT747]
MEAQFYYRNPAAPAPNKPPSIGVTALIRDGSGSLLLEKRADSERWAFIGGATLTGTGRRKPLYWNKQKAGRV